MAWNIVKTFVPDAGVTMVSVGFDDTDPTGNQETAAIGIDEATISAAGLGTTPVASPTSTPLIGVGRVGIDYSARGRSERCLVCGFVWPLRTMMRQRGGYVDRDCWDQRIPIRGRTGQARSRRWTYFGQF